MYVKLFSSIYQGTLRGNSHGLLVFTNLLAHCDRLGIADIHPRAIAEEVGLSVKQVQAALESLEAVDTESRSPEEEGRRITRLDAHRAWGWTVVNYAKYRAIRDEDDRREQNREAQARWREKQVDDSKQSKPRKPKSAQAEADGEGEGDIPPSATHLSPLRGGNRGAKMAPDSFLVTSELQQWAREKVPLVDIRTETELFRANTFKTARTHWPKTWQGWMLREQKRLAERAGHGESAKDRAARERAEEISTLSARKRPGAPTQPQPVTETYAQLNND